LAERPLDVSHVIVESVEGSPADGMVEVGRDLQSGGLVRDLGQRIAAQQKRREQHKRLKAETTVARWLDVTLLSMLALGTTVLTATPARTESIATTEPKPAARVRNNAVSLRPLAVIPAFGVDVGYERALGRRWSVGGRITYFFPRVGYGHLQGIAETVAGRLWLPRPLHGLFAEASLGVAHVVLARSPALSKTAIVPGLSAGARWQFRNGLLLGASGGLRWGHVVADERILCTRSAPCPAVRSGAYAQLAIEVGYAF
jgi:hypothetical protein